MTFEINKRIELARRQSPVCMCCGGPATCFGEYETQDGTGAGYACGECCGHGNEDGHCAPFVFSFCESTFAGPFSPWHIRILTPKGRRTGGGIDTNFLCNMGNDRTTLQNPGWDLEVKITPHHLGHSCRGCVEAYRALVEAKGE